MNCPVCKTAELLVADRLGIEIDYCPKCRGVWLDRGELDKIIEHALHEMPLAGPGEVRRSSSGHDRHEDDHDQHDHDDDHHHGDYDERYRGHKRKSLLRDLFDF